MIVVQISFLFLIFSSLSLKHQRNLLSHSQHFNDNCGTKYFSFTGFLCGAHRMNAGMATLRLIGVSQSNPKYKFSKQKAIFEISSNLFLINPAAKVGHGSANLMTKAGSRKEKSVQILEARPVES